MRNTITLKNTDGSPKTGAVVTVYNWQSGSPYYSTLVDTATEITGKGQYYIDVTTGFKGTVLIDSVVDEGMTGVMFRGEDADVPDGSITTAKIADGAVTAIKTDFAYE